MTQPIDFYDDMINVRDITARFEDIEDILDDTSAAGPGDPDREEAQELKNILEELCGNGGDEQWRGDWYPSTLIAARYFKTYAQDLAEETGAIDSNATWPMRCIDWDQAAEELQQDYAAIEIGDRTFFYR